MQELLCPLPRVTAAQHAPGLTLMCARKNKKPTLLPCWPVALKPAGLCCWQAGRPCCLVAADLLPCWLAGQAGRLACCFVALLPCGLLASCLVGLLKQPAPLAGWLASWQAGMLDGWQACWLSGQNKKRLLLPCVDLSLLPCWPVGSFSRPQRLVGLLACWLVAQSEEQSLVACWLVWRVASLA